MIPMEKLKGELLLALQVDDLISFAGKLDTANVQDLHIDEPPEA